MRPEAQVAIVAAGLTFAAAQADPLAPAGLPALGQTWVERGTTHKIVAEFDGAAARLTVDAQVVLEYLDPQPLRGEGHDGLGFCIWSGGAIDNVRIYQPKPGN